MDSARHPNRIKDGAITAYFSSTVTRITEDEVILATPLGSLTLPNDFVFALTGYHPDFSFLEKLGIHFDEANDRCPVCDPATLESNVPGIYLAGVILAGRRTNEIFIENGRFHGKLIAEDLQRKLEIIGQRRKHGLAAGFSPRPFRSYAWISSRALKFGEVSRLRSPMLFSDHD